MVNYFKSIYSPCAYSPDWYGTLSYAPSATVLMYDDENLFCVGYMESELPEGVETITEQEALNYVNNADENNPNIFKGDKLIHRWDSEVVTDG